MGTKRCCCGCPLITKPWRTARLEFLGMTFDVEFPETPDEACCQQEISVCKDIGEPQLFADCYTLPISDSDWFLINRDHFLSTSGPFCDWPLVVVPLTAVDSCCNSSNYRIEWTGRSLTRHWVWKQAYVRFTICYCRTEDGKPGYRMRIEINWRVTAIYNRSSLVKYRHRKYTRVCCEESGGGGGTTTEAPPPP
jgi:hypothetical protein